MSRLKTFSRAFLEWSMPTMMTLLAKAAAAAAYIHVPQTTCSISGSGLARFHSYREALTARSFCHTTCRIAATRRCASRALAGSTAVVRSPLGGFREGAKRGR